MTPIQEKFVLHWGEMGSRWGINRTIAQIHALLFTSAAPLHADAIVEELQVARSNVSNSLRELQTWGVVKIVHVIGDRRDHFECIKDVWEMFRLVLDERKRRETDPTLAALREYVAAAKSSGSPEAYTRDRLSDLLEFFESMDTWYSQTRKMPTPAVKRFVKLGDKVAKMFGISSKDS